MWESKDGGGGILGTPLDTKTHRGRASAADRIAPLVGQRADLEARDRRGAELDALRDVYRPPEAHVQTRPADAPEDTEDAPAVVSQGRRVSVGHALLRSLGVAEDARAAEQRRQYVLGSILSAVDRAPRTRRAGAGHPRAYAADTVGPGDAVSDQVDEERGNALDDDDDEFLSGTGQAWGGALAAGLQRLEQGLSRKVASSAPSARCTVAFEEGSELAGSELWPESDDVNGASDLPAPWHDFSRDAFRAEERSGDAARVVAAVRRTLEARSAREAQMEEAVAARARARAGAQLRSGFVAPGMAEEGVERVGVKVGDAVRREYAWRPEKIVCKRFEVDVPDVESEEEGEGGGRDWWEEVAGRGGVESGEGSDDGFRVTGVLDVNGEGGMSAVDERGQVYGDDVREAQERLRSVVFGEVEYIPDAGGAVVHRDARADNAPEDGPCGGAESADENGERLSPDMASIRAAAAVRRARGGHPWVAVDYFGDKNV